MTMSRKVLKFVRISNSLGLRTFANLRFYPAYPQESSNLLVGHRTFHTSLPRFDDSDKTKPQKVGSLQVDKPMLMIAFTCKRCDTRSSHTMSKQAYTKGTVLIQCPGCKNRHLIADHLKIFNDDHITIEDIMNAKGESVSLTTNDLAFEDVPESLKDVIGHYAKDAPDSIKKKLDNDTVHHLPSSDK